MEKFNIIDNQNSGTSKYVSSNKDHRMSKSRKIVDKVTSVVHDACESKSNYFGAGIWKDHILLVKDIAMELADKTGADTEVVELAALLHDYASVRNKEYYEDHHLHGARLAEELLSELGYPRDKISVVKECIESHRASKPMTHKSVEAQCIADADAMSHFFSVGSLYYLAFNSHGMKTDEASEWIAGKLERSWEKLSPEAKKIVSKKYAACKLILLRS